MLDLITFCIGASIVFKVFSALAPLSLPARPAKGVLRGALADFADALGFIKRHRLMFGLFGYSSSRAS